MPDQPAAPKSTRRHWAIRPDTPPPPVLKVVLIADSVAWTVWYATLVGDVGMGVVCIGFVLVTLLLTHLGCVRMETGWLVARGIVAGLTALIVGFLVVNFGLAGQPVWAWVGTGVAALQTLVLATCIYGCIRIRLVRRGTPRTRMVMPLAVGRRGPARARGGMRVRDPSERPPGHRVIPWRPSRPRFLTAAVLAEVAYVAIFFTTLIVAHGWGALAAIVWFSIPVFVDLGCWNMDRPFLVARIVLGGIVCLIAVFGLDLAVSEKAMWVGWNGVMFVACGHALTAWRKGPVERTAGE